MAGNQSEDTGMKQTRREWLAGAASAVAGGVLAAKVGAAEGGAETFIPKIGMCDWSIGRVDVSAFELGKRIGLDGIEVSIGGKGDKLKLRQPELQEKYLETARQLDMSIPSVAMGVLNEVPLKSEPKAALWVADTIRVARKLGAKNILLAFFGAGELWERPKVEVDRVVDVLIELAPRAERAGVVLGLENYLSAEDNLKILERVKSDAVQIYYDVFNSGVTRKYDAVKEIKLMGKHMCQIHFKEGNNFLGSGQVDWPAVAGALKEINYRGWVVLETASPTRDMVADTKKNLEYVKKLFAS
jgi:L-ribulose-5-phosphate 3-epimerase